ncbi:MAG: hypothetical protein IKG42_00045 [Clostridia bacterium]|nr:hypothetical protein [Clostridia bacterium]
MKTFRYIRGGSSSDALILHLDGDRKYSKRAFNYYSRLNIKAVVENVAESRQEFVVCDLLKKYRPDILVITGHDAMYKRGQRFYSIENYKNSKFFVNTVKRARRWNKSEEDLIIYAGACESFYEAIMAEGANFASSPGRIMIDYMDPLIVASKVAMTPKNKYITIREVSPFLKNGMVGVGGTKARGKY